MDASPHFVDWVFENVLATQQFFAFIERSKLSESEERSAFKIIKSVFMRCHKNILAIFIKDEYYLTVLKCLSCFCVIM